MNITYDFSETNYGKFICIEGLDASSKSTQTQMLLEYLTKQYESTNGIEYIHYPRLDVEPIGNLISKFLRGEFGTLNQVDPYLVALLYASDRNLNNEHILNCKKDNKYILLDRYVYSNVAYQGAKVPDNKFLELKNWILDLEYKYMNLVKPDITIFLDAPLNFIKKKLTSNKRTGKDRQYLNGKDDIHEADIDFQSRVRTKYLLAVDGDDKFVKIDCSDSNGDMLSKNDVFEKILEVLRNKKIIK